MGEDKRGRNGHVSGNNGNGTPVEDENGPDSDAPAEADDDATQEAGMPAPVVDLAAACVRFVTQRYRVPLDFTPDTLSLVDQYVRDARLELKEKPETLALVQGAVGAYLGEVIRLAHGGVWRAEGEESSWRVLMTRVFLSFNPIGMAREALLLEEAEGWGAHLEVDAAEREVVDRRLSALPETDLAEYYLPTTRFDVVQIAADALRERMRSSGLGDVKFDQGDYK